MLHARARVLNAGETVDVNPCGSNSGNVDVYDDGTLIKELTPGVTGYGIGSQTQETLEVTLHTIDREKVVCGGSGSCKGPIGGAEVRVFDRFDPDFDALWTSESRRNALR